MDRKVASRENDEAAEQSGSRPCSRRARQLPTQPSQKGLTTAMYLPRILSSYTTTFQNTATPTACNAVDMKRDASPLPPYTTPPPQYPLGGHYASRFAWRDSSSLSNFRTSHRCKKSCLFRKPFPSLVACCMSPSMPSAALYVSQSNEDFVTCGIERGVGRYKGGIFDRSIAPLVVCATVAVPGRRPAKKLPSGIPQLTATWYTNYINSVVLS